MADGSEILDQLYVHLSRTKCDRDKLIFCAERGGQYNPVIGSFGATEIGKCQKGVNHAEVPYHLQIWEWTLGFLAFEMIVTSAEV